MRRRTTTIVSTIVKRSIVIRGHKTSVSLEDPFWSGFKQIARDKKTTMAAVAQDLDERRSGNLSSAIRVFVLDHYRSQHAAGASV